MNGYGWVQIKLYLQNQAMDKPAGCHLQPPALDPCSEFYSHPFLSQSFLNNSPLIVSTSSLPIYSAILVIWLLPTPFHWNWPQQSHQYCHMIAFSLFLTYTFLLQWLLVSSSFWNIFLHQLLWHHSHSVCHTYLSAASEFSISLAKTSFMEWDRCSCTKLSVQKGPCLELNIL